MSVCGDVALASGFELEDDPDDIGVVSDVFVNTATDLNVRNKVLFSKYRCTGRTAKLFIRV